MAPTLKGGKGNGDSGVAHFGLVDTSDLAKKKTKRFDIVTTYYPWDDSDYPTGYKPGEKNSLGETAERKIKRVLALPGETITVSKGDITVYQNAYSVSNFEFNTNYKFGAIPTDTKLFHNFYVSGIGAKEISTTYSYANSKDIFVIKTSTENVYRLGVKNGEQTNYLNAKADGDSYKLSIDMTSDTDWNFNSNFGSFSTKIMNHTNSSFDGEYIFALTINTESESASKITLTKLSDINLSSMTVAKLISRDESKVVTFFPKKSEKPAVDTDLDERIAACEHTHYTLSFERLFDQRPGTYKDFADVVLKDGRYWVQGDHWANSTDCYNNTPIYYDNLEGLLVVIEGTCTIGRNDKGEKVCTNHQYSTPMFF